MSTKQIKAALYIRVSTDEQTTLNQREALQALCAQRGWPIIQVYEDAGVSGAKGRDKRPGLDKALKDATRGRYTVLVAWSVDRLGRSLSGLCDTLEGLQAAGVDLVLHQQGVDTTTSAGKALFGMLGVFAEFERAILQERIRAGLERARRQGRVSGRKKVSAETERLIRESLEQRKHGVNKTARLLGVGNSVVARVKQQMLAEEA